MCKIYYNFSILALREHTRLGHLPKTAIGTASVIETIDTMFDLMNSTSLHQLENKKAVSESSLESKLQVCKSCYVVMYS
jgi:hypothetical protein